MTTSSCRSRSAARAAPAVQAGPALAVHVLRPEPGSTLAVFGAGGVGLSAVIAAVHLTGATVVVVDVNPARLELATRLGAAHTINAREDDPVDALQQISGGGGIDRTLEATGVPSVLRQAIDVLAPRGVCGIVGAPAPDAEVRPRYPPPTTVTAPPSTAERLDSVGPFVRLGRTASRASTPCRRMSARENLRPPWRRPGELLGGGPRTGARRSNAAPNGSKRAAVGHTRRRTAS